MDKTKLDFACTKCDFKTYAKKYLLIHIQKAHEQTKEQKEPKIICETCGSKFMFKCHLKEHIVIISKLIFRILMPA